MAATSPLPPTEGLGRPPVRPLESPDMHERLVDYLSRWVGEEPANTLREAVLCSFDLAPIVPRCETASDVVVLVHGFMATAGCFRPLKRRIEAETCARVASFSHAPGATVRGIAVQLAALVDRLPPHVRVHLVGHSLGGLVARYYVQELGGDARVVQTVSLGTPFGGAPSAARFPYLVGADIRPGSRLLERLRASASASDVPHTSIVGTDDRTLGDASRGIFVRGEAITLPGRGHNTLLFDRDAADHVLACIQAHARPRPFPEPHPRASHERPCDSTSPPLLRCPS